MTDAERARCAFDAARSAHELEVALRSVAESLWRSEAPDKLTLGFIPSLLDRLKLLTATLPEPIT